MTSVKRKPYNRAPKSSPKGVREQAAGTQVAITYVESSAVVAGWLEGDTAARHALVSPGRLVTSAITFAEARRAIVRARAGRRISADQEASILQGLAAQAAHCQLAPVSDTVLSRVGRPFPIEPVRTLDAIHLATLEGLGVAPHLVTVVTRDARVAANARALGFPVAGG